MRAFEYSFARALMTNRLQFIVRSLQNLVHIIRKFAHYLNIKLYFFPSYRHVYARFRAVNININLARKYRREYAPSRMYATAWFAHLCQRTCFGIKFTLTHTHLFPSHNSGGRRPVGDDMGAKWYKTHVSFTYTYVNGYIYTPATQHHHICIRTHM